MKTAIVYYSMSNNVDYVAKRIAEITDADLIRLVPKNEYPSTGFKKFYWGGKSAIMGEMPELEPYDWYPSTYDKIIFGSPVWASRFAPPIRTFINDNKDYLTGKKIGAFVCYSGSGATSALNKLQEFLKIDEFFAEMKLIDPYDKKSDAKEQLIDDFIDKIQ